MTLSAKIMLLLLLGLGLIVLVVLRLRRRSGVRIPLGLSAVSFFAIVYLMMDEIRPLIGHLHWLDNAQIEQAIASLFWVSIAYTTNVFIKRFVYRRRLTAEGDYKVPLIVQYLVTALIYLFALMIIVRTVYNQPIFALAATSGALAIVLGYSARAVLEEVFAGIALNFSSPFEKGDMIQLNDEWATVKDIGWRSITYLDMDNNNVVVPNSVVAASKIRNLDRPNPVVRRLNYFLIEYNVPPRVVIELAEAAMHECPSIMDHEWNEVSLIGFEDAGIKYRVAFHIDDMSKWWLSSNEYFNALWYRFKREGVRFGQQRHLNFSNGEDADKGLPSSALDDNNWRALVDRFNQTPMFDGMTNLDMDELARSARLHVVGPPERIIRAGSMRTSMYLLAAGEADVYEVNDYGKETWMASVCEGETVGLMSLLTGAPQRTTIRARTETAAWEISSESLHALFDRKPEVMDNIAEAVTKWQAEEDDALQAIQMSRKQEQQLLDKRASSLSKRISRFFDRDGIDEDDSGERYTEF
ncbi:MAG: small-conductance mechanosensitive channel/CRP-like cAMP-binding protein [Cryomorphaceae bacterium]|jgi:small-conductance mechanosensitive channel/CRP-like cAMP-binding protein